MDLIVENIAESKMKYKLTSKTLLFTDVDVDRVIEMAWEDRTPFDAIEFQFGLREADVKDLMKKNLKMSSYQLWRKRVHTISIKHVAKRSKDVTRFKCTMQKAISMNKISKR
jgi:uncharacterized protein (TIGR03643 family)